LMLIQLLAEKFDVDPASGQEVWGWSCPWLRNLMLILPLFETFDVYPPHGWTIEPSVQSYSMLLILSLAACLQPVW
jgi:hypothetical protein